MNFDFSKITSYFNIGLVVLFITFVVGVLVAGLRGLRRGVWKSTHNMVFMLSLVIIAIATLDPFCKFVENFDISIFFKGTLWMSKTVEGETITYYIPITSVKETATEFVKGFYYMYNVSATASGATNFAFAIVESALKIVLFIVDIILIATLGNILSFITWFAIFQHFIPKIARKVVKIRWLGAIETAVTFVVLTALFFTPLTSLVNSLNQSYQRNKPKSDNEMIINIGNFVDAYNDSLFAKILFNWSAGEDGMTFDTRLFSTFTTGISGDVSVSLVSELANLTNLVIIGGSGITSTEEAQFAYDATQLLTKEIVDSAFGVLTKSNLLTSILPIVTDIALNSSVLDGYIPNRLIDVSDVDWKNEIGYLQDMVDCLFDSGVMDTLIVKDEKGRNSFRSFEGQNVVDFINDIIYHPDFDKILNVFKSIDDSKVLSRAVPALTYYFMSNDTSGTMKQYLPLSWEELNEFSWGYECYVLFDFLHKTITLDEDKQFLKAILIKAGAYTPKEGEEVESLERIISKNVDKFNDLIVGEFDDTGKLLHADKYGRTIVFDKGQRIAGRNYCLFDMMIFDKILPSVVDSLFDLDFMKDFRKDVSPEDENSFHDAVAALNEGVRLVNFKKEFNAILDIVGTVAKDSELLEAITGGKGLESLMKEEGNFFSIDASHINYFKQALIKMDESSLLYSALVPVLKGLIGGQDLGNSMNDIGLRNDVMVDAIVQDSKKEHHTFFADLASILDRWEDLANVYQLTQSSSGSSNVMDQLKDEKLVDSLIRILSVIYKNPIFNPTPEVGNTSYEKNENLYGLLEYVFNMTKDMGLTITRDKMRQVETYHTWDEEFNAVGNIIKYIASHDVLNAADMFNDGLTRSAIANLNEEGEGKVGLPKLFTLVDDSYLFKSSLGPFLDDMFGDALSGFLIDKETGVSFGNITSWAEEGQRISNLLTSLSNLIPADDSEAKDFLSNFDMKKLDNIVELNDMLHQLSHSGIFTYIDENNVSHYQFGTWFYQKINDAMVKFNVNANEYDLLADPKVPGDATWTWNDANWGKRPGVGIDDADPYFVDYQSKYNADGSAAETHMIAYRDFVYLGGKDNSNITLPTDWCDYEQFTVKQAAFLAAHKTDLTDPTGPYLTNDWNAYFASDDFIADYDNVFNLDEIGRVCKFMTYSMRVLENRTSGAGAGTQVPFNELPLPVLDGLLTSINETKCLRICLYNFYRIAAENLLNNVDAFNLSSAYNIYIIDANYPMFDFEHSRPARQAELDKMLSFYEVIDKARTKGIITGNNFDYSKLNQDGFIADMKTAMKNFNDSYIFHRSGSSKVDALTTFQTLFNSMLSQSSVKDVIYLAASPKDAAATAYNSQETKVRYLVTSTFLTNAEISDAGLSFATEQAKQFGEIDGLLDCVDALYSLKDKDGNPTTSINDADMNKSENIDIINTLFTNLNNSNLLYDCLPNSIYNIFVQNDQLSIQSGTEKVDFKSVDPYYHYYFNDTVQRAAPDYTAKYLSKDISGIISLLTDYQEFNTQLSGKQMSDPATLKVLTGEGGALKSVLMDMHDSNLFHTPARNYDASIRDYYTDKYNPGFTLFEEMMSKVCSFVQLDNFAYDETYEPDVTTYGSASNKMQAKVHALTTADDTGVASGIVYHTTQGTAWEDEVNAILHLANVTSELGSGEALNVASINLNDLTPTQIKSMLTAVNASDMIADAIPKFVENGFNAINLGTLTTYDTINYAYYHLGQVGYGGVNATAPAGSEIDNIYQVMSALYNESTHAYYTNMNNLTDFVQGEGGEARLGGLLRFIYESRIFDTSRNNGVYKEYNVISGHNVSAQGIMLYNSLGSDLCAYVARDADSTTPAKEALDKIATFSTIIHMANYFEDEVNITSQVETRGLKRLIDLTNGQINANTFSDNSVETIKAKKSLILGIVESSYNTTNATDPAEYKRSAIVSEFISGLFNTILENQYTKLATDKPTYQYQVYSFGNDDAATLTLASYSDLNVIERDGLEGLLDSLQYITTANPHTLQANREQIKNCFTMMGRNPGENSHLAQALYLTEAHQYLLLLRNPLVTNGGEMFVPVNELSADPATDNNIYSNTFSFKEYGERIDNFLNGATILV